MTGKNNKTKIVTTYWTKAKSTQIRQSDKKDQIISFEFEQFSITILNKYYNNRTS